MRTEQAERAVHQIISEHLKGIGMSQTKLARLTGIEVSLINRKLSGKIGLSLSDVKLMAKALNLSVTISPLGVR